jgi:hypothetical protein
MRISAARAGKRRAEERRAEQRRGMHTVCSSMMPVHLDGIGSLRAEDEKARGAAGGGGFVSCKLVSKFNGRE